MDSKLGDNIDNSLIAQSLGNNQIFLPKNSVPQLGQHFAAPPQYAPQQVVSQPAITQPQITQSTIPQQMSLQVPQQVPQQMSLQVPQQVPQQALQIGQQQIVPSLPQMEVGQVMQNTGINTMSLSAPISTINSALYMNIFGYDIPKKTIYIAIVFIALIIVYYFYTKSAKKEAESKSNNKDSEKKKKNSKDENKSVSEK